MIGDPEVQKALRELSKEHPHYIANFADIEEHLLDVDAMDDKQEWLRVLGDQVAAVFYSDFLKYNEVHDSVLPYSYLEHITWQKPAILDLFDYLNNLLSSYVTEDTFKNIKINIRYTGVENPTVITLAELVTDTTWWYSALVNANKNLVVTDNAKKAVKHKTKSKKHVTFGEQVIVHENNEADGNNIIDDHYKPLAAPDNSAGLWWSLKHVLHTRDQKHVIRHRKSTASLEDSKPEVVRSKLRGT